MITISTILPAIFLLVARFSFHPWNFSPVLPLFLRSGKQSRIHFILLALALLISDLILGFSYSLFFGYAVYFGFALFMKRSSMHWLKTSVLASFVFFFVTNFAVWLEGGLYPQTPAGLVACFTAAIPFFGNTLLGNIFYSYLLFEIVPLLNSKVKGKVSFVKGL